LIKNKKQQQKKNKNAGTTKASCPSLHIIYSNITDY